MAREYPGIYRYVTKQGPRYRYNFRDSDDKQSCKRGFLSPQAAAIDKAGLTVQAVAGTLGSAVAQSGAPGIVGLVTDREAVSTLGEIPRGQRERGGFSASGASAVAGVGLDRFDPLIVVPT